VLLEFEQPACSDTVASTAAARSINSNRRRRERLPPTSARPETGTQKA